MTTASAIDSTRQRVRAVFGGSVGNLIEWYDWYTYSACAIYFAPLFFRRRSDHAVAEHRGDLRRRLSDPPLGGWVLGRYADRSGRKAALTLSVMLMCLGSLMIAFTPAYATDRHRRRPITLMLARLLQGFSVGGEYGTSATYMSEITPAHQRGFYSVFCTSRSSWVSCSRWRAAGPAVGSLSHDQLEAWGWRIPFVIGAVAALGGLYLRRNLPETETFQKHRASGGRAGRSRLLMQHPREVLIVIGLTMGGTLYFYVHDVHPAVPREHGRPVEDRTQRSSRRHRCSCSC